MNKNDIRWQERFEELIAYKEIYGHCDVPNNFSENQQLGRWVHRQRQEKDKVPDDRKSQLTELGFSWDLLTETWGVRYEQLKSFKEEYGHCNVPVIYQENPPLGKWVNTQRRIWREEKMMEDREQLLTQIGFQWELVKGEWHQRYAECQAYKEQNQSCCDLAQIYNDNPYLGKWIEKQSHDWQGKLSGDRTNLLAQIGFMAWVIQTPQECQVWNHYYQELKQYKAIYGDCHISRSYYAEHPDFGGWIKQQRFRRLNGYLSQERQDMLDQIGFQWKVHDNWQQRYEELQSYKDTHGDCNVPSHTPEYPQLGRWAETQRDDWNKGLLSKPRTELLHQIGFKWILESPAETQLWQQRYQELKAYKEARGNCNVPKRYKGNTLLAHWTNWQLRRRDMSADQRKLLEEIGFEFQKESIGTESKSLSSSSLGVASRREVVNEQQGEVDMEGVIECEHESESESREASEDNGESDDNLGKEQQEHDEIMSKIHESIVEESMNSSTNIGILSENNELAEASSSNEVARLQAQVALLSQRISIIEDEKTAISKNLQQSKEENASIRNENMMLLNNLKRMYAQVSKLKESNKDDDALAQA